jgi:hypothetical protein
MESDKLVALRFKINELKMLDFLEKKEKIKCLLLEQFQDYFLGKPQFVKTIVLIVEVFKISEIRIFSQE